MRPGLKRITAQLALWLVIAGILLPAMVAVARSAVADGWSSDWVICRTDDGTRTAAADRQVPGADAALAEHCPWCRLPGWVALPPPDMPVGLAVYSQIIRYTPTLDEPVRPSGLSIAHRSRAPPTPF